MRFSSKSFWQIWIWYLFSSNSVVFLESSFANVGNDLRIYLTLIVTKCGGERSISYLKMDE